MVDAVINEGGPEGKRTKPGQPYGRMKRRRDRVSAEYMRGNEMMLILIYMTAEYQNAILGLT